MQTLRVHPTSTPAHPPQKKTTPRILFVGEAVCLAHVGRPAMLARWAKEAGYEVAFACGPDFSNAARGEGLQPIPIKTIDLNTLAERHKNNQFFYDDHTLDQYVSAERHLIRRWQPDLIVGDFRLTLPISAHLENIPMLSLINAHWSPAHPCRMPAPRSGFMKHCSPSVRDGLIGMVLPFIFRYFASALDRLRIRNGLPALKDLRRLYTSGDACAYLDIPELIPLRKMPLNHFYLGPLVWKPQATGSLNLDHLSPSRPLAYVSMGSTGDNNIIPAILKSLEASKFNAVLTGVDQSWGDAWMRSHPKFKGRLLCSTFVDPNDILKRSAVCLCHSGSGTVYQSLTHGVPLFCFPHNPDQGLIAKCVQAAKVGFTLSPDHTQTPRVTTILRERFLESDHLTKNAGTFSRTLKLWDTKQRWTTWLNSHFHANMQLAPSSSPNKNLASLASAV